MIFLLGILKNHKINTKIIREKICKIDFKEDESSNRTSSIMTSVATSIKNNIMRLNPSL